MDGTFIANVDAPENKILKPSRLIKNIKDTFFFKATEVTANTGYSRDEFPIEAGTNWSLCFSTKAGASFLSPHADVDDVLWVIRIEQE